MADVTTLNATARSRLGKGGSRTARRDGMTPCVIFGDKKDSLAIAIDSKILTTEIHRPAFFQHLIDIEVDGQKHRVLARDVQFHPVTDAPLHVDFLRASERTVIDVEVPVIFENEEESPGIKRGGVLNIVRHEIEVRCRADSIPESFFLDLTGLDIGDSLHASNLSLPSGVELTIADRDFTIATVAAPTVVAEEAAAEAAEGEEGAEGAEGAEGEAAEGAVGEGASAEGGEEKSGDE